MCMCKHMYKSMYIYLYVHVSMYSIDVYYLSYPGILILSIASKDRTSHKDSLHEGKSFMIL